MSSWVEVGLDLSDSWSQAKPVDQSHLQKLELLQILDMSSYTLEESHERILIKSTRNSDKKASFCWSSKFEGKDNIWILILEFAFCGIQELIETMLVGQLSVEMQNFSPHL